jgi:hypothetical protein
VLVRRTLRQRTKAARAPVARTHRSATATDKQSQGDDNVAVGMGGGQREGKSDLILVVARVGMCVTLWRNGTVRRRVSRRSAWRTVAAWR